VVFPFTKIQKHNFFFLSFFFFLNKEKESPISHAICQFDATATPVKIHGNALGT
jgi:hypothetical protein